MNLQSNFTFTSNQLPPNPYNNITPKPSSHAKKENPSISLPQNILSPLLVKPPPSPLSNFGSYNFINAPPKMPQKPRLLNKCKSVERQSQIDKAFCGEGDIFISGMKSNQQKDIGYPNEQFVNNNNQFSTYLQNQENTIPSSVYQQGYSLSSKDQKSFIPSNPIQRLQDRFKTKPLVQNQRNTSHGLYLNDYKGMNNTPDNFSCKTQLNNSQSSSNLPHSLQQQSETFKSPLYSQGNTSNEKIEFPFLSTMEGSQNFQVNNNQGKSYVKLNSILNQRDQKRDVLKIISPSTILQSSISQYKASTLPDESSTAIQTLPSMQGFPSPKRTPFNLWGERCDTNESEGTYKNYWEILNCESNKGDSAIINAGGEGDRIINQTQKDKYVSRSHSCSLLGKEYLIRKDFLNISDGIKEQPEINVQNLQNEIENLKQSNKNLVDKQGQDKKQIDDKASEISYLQRVINDLTEQVQSLKSKNNVIIIENNEKQQQLNTLNLDMQFQDSTKYDQLSQNLNFMESKLKYLISQVFFCFIFLFHNRQIESENDQLKNAENDFQRREDSHLQKINQLRDEILLKDQEKEKSRQEITQLWKLLSESISPEDSQNLRAGLSQSEIQIKELTQRLNESQEKVKEQGQKIIDLQHKMVMMSEKAKEAADKARESSTKLVEVSEEARRLKESNIYLEKVRDQLQQMINTSNEQQMQEQDKQKYWREESLHLNGSVKSLIEEFQGMNVENYNGIQQIEILRNTFKNQLFVVSKQEEQLREKKEITEDLSRRVAILQEQLDRQLQINQELVNQKSDEVKEDATYQQYLQTSNSTNKGVVSALKIQELIDREMHLFEQKYRDRMADIEKEMFTSMHERDSKIAELQEENKKLGEINEQRLVEQKILQAHLERKQDEIIISTQQIEELQKRIDLLSSISNSTKQNNSVQRAQNILSKDKLKQIDSIREEEDESFDDNESSRCHSSQQQLSTQSKSQSDQGQTSNQTENNQQDDIPTKQSIQELSEKLNQKRKMIAKMRKEVDKLKEKLLDYEEKEFTLTSHNRQLSAELERVRASSEDIPKLLEMLKSRKEEYVELKRRFDSMKIERDQALKERRESDTHFNNHHTNNNNNNIINFTQFSKINSNADKISRRSTSLVKNSNTGEVESTCIKPLEQQ